MRQREEASMADYEARDGYLLVDVSKDKTGRFVRRDKDDILIDVPGPLYIRVPVTEETVEREFAAYTTKFYGVEYRGWAGACARFKLHIFENEVVGKLKERAKKAGEPITEAKEIQDELLGWFVGNPLDGAGAPSVNEDKVRELANQPEALLAYLAKMGIQSK